MANTDTQPDKADTVKQLRLNWVLPEGMVAKRAVSVLVQPGDTGEVIVMFFDVRQPILTGDEAEVLSALEQVGSADAVCTARLVIPTGKFIEFAAVFKQVADTLKPNQP